MTIGVEDQALSEKRLAGERLRRIRQDRVVRWAAAAAIAWIGAFAVATALVSGNEAGERAVGNVAYLIPLVAATALALMAARQRHGRARRFWAVLAASNAFWLTGELIWSAYELGLEREPPFPSAADAFYLTSYALVVPAILLAFGGISRVLMLRGVLDASIIVVAVGVAGYTLVIAPQLAQSNDESALATAVGLAYPLLGLLILMTIVAVGFNGHQRTPPTIKLVAAAFAVTAVTDVAYSYLVVLHEYRSGGWLNVGWQVEACLLSLAALTAWRHDEGVAEVRARDRDRGLPLVLAGVACTLALVLWNNAAALAGAYAVFAVLVRLQLTISDKAEIARRLEGALREQERLAVTDPLTGLHNRRFFDEILRHEVARAKRQQASVGLVVLNLDHFQHVNDALGHASGDEVLRSVARRLAHTVRASDILARYGGEEFVVIVPDAVAPEVRQLAERCRAAICESPITVDGQDVSTTASVGLAVLPQHADHTEELLRHGEKALLLAKRLGRNQVRSSLTPTAEDFSVLIGDNLVMDYLQVLADDIDGRQAGQDHSVAMARWANLVASELGLDEESTWQAVAGARLHDIGKVSVPDAILAKPSALTEDEWRIMREHPDRGARLVALDPMLAPLARPIFEHHERVNGSGYPAGKRANEISIQAKIISVCDAWAAMRADRAYRPALAVEAARQQLQAGAGSQFDPTVVEAFLRLQASGLVGALEDLVTTGRLSRPVQRP